MLAFTNCIKGTTIPREYKSLGIEIKYKEATKLWYVHSFIFILLVLVIFYFKSKTHRFALISINFLYYDFYN